MRVLFVFERGRANFGSGRQHSKTKVAELIEAALDGTDAEYLCSFYTTGNHAIRVGDDMSTTVLARLIATATGLACAVVTAETLRTAERALAAWEPPAPAPGCRWTPGLGFLIDGTPSVAELLPSRRAVLCRLSDDVVGVYRRDRETPAGRIDAKRRDGGWGAVSEDIATRIGGRWTARAISRVEGLRRLTEAHIAAR